METKVDYTKLTKAELVVALNDKDDEIKSLNNIIAQKNNEINGDTSKKDLHNLKIGYNDLLAKHNVLISDVKNFTQLITSGTELISSSLNKSILGLANHRTIPMGQPGMAIPKK